MKIPVKYVPSTLNKRSKKQQIKQIIKSKKLYKKKKYHTRKKIPGFKSKKSNHITNAQSIYKVSDIKPSKQLANATKCNIKGLSKIVKKGQGAYFSSGSRPNQTAHSWGYARLASAISGGKASIIDFNILKENCSKSSKALKLAINAKKNKSITKTQKIKVGGKKKSHNKSRKTSSYLRFKDYPDFTPNLSPREIFKLGSFGGTYWRPIKSKFYKNKLKNQHKKYPKSWWKNIPENHLSESWDKYDININKYGVKVGTTLEFWEDKGWINKTHPYGWVQWYCDFYSGKRSSDDQRQINRWKNLAGPNGRFRKWLITEIFKKGTKKDWNNHKISPAIRQTLQHWGYKLTKRDVLNKR